MCVFAVTDPRNVEVPQHFLPLLVGLVVGMIGLSYGYNCGFAINPARDMGPRIFTWMAGYGSEVFRYCRILLFIFAAYFNDFSSVIEITIGFGFQSLVLTLVLSSAP